MTRPQSAPPAVQTVPKHSMHSTGVVACDDLYDTESPMTGDAAAAAAAVGMTCMNSVLVCCI